MESVFAHDAVVDYTGSATDPASGTNHSPDGTMHPLIGAAEIVDTCMRGAANFVSSHHGHMPEIDITGEDSAFAIWAMSDVVRFKSNPTTAGLNGFGHYHEWYRKIDGNWRIKKLRLTRLLLEPIASKQTPPHSPLEPGR